ncbi:MAG: 2Fe-2S iron-sulfur cluster-binding protein [Panacagrimonas sp.]
MGKVTYIEFNGAMHEIEVRSGQSLMEGAVGNMIPGILADCGGACACATCHVYVDPEWSERVGAPSDMEFEMLDVVTGREPHSRLSCQIRMSDEYDGLVLRLPETQT